MQKPTTLPAKLVQIKNELSTQTAVKFKKDSSWKSWTWAEYFEQIQVTAMGLKDLGVKTGTKVGIFSNTRVEWAIVDLATLSLGAVTVPIYPSNTSEELLHILNHSELEILFVEHGQHLKILEAVEKKCPALRKTFCFESETWQQFQHRGQTAAPDVQTKWLESIDSISPNQMATLVYTSGTTGVPKAAVLNHEQIMSEVSEAFQLCGIGPNDTSLTFLPYSHVLGRIEVWAQAYIGYTLAYAEGLEKIRQNLIDIKPTFLIAVPRIFEKIYAAVWAQLESNPLRRKAFEWALAVGLKISHKKLHRQNLQLAEVLEYELAKKLVLNKVKESFGGHLRFAVSGGAPIHQDIAHFFHAAEVLILEGYGLTETTAAICVNTPYNYKFGSVGRPIGDVQLKIAEDGEILVQSKKVMQGYYKDKKSTDEVLKKGWFHTGDIGEILNSGDLKITDRKKDLIKTAGGKYVAPQKLEGLLKLNPLIAQALIHGDQRKYVVALVTLEKSQLESLAKAKAWSYDRWQELLERSEVIDQVRKAISEANSKLASFETIKKYLVLPHEFTIESGDLTPSLKIKRKILDQKYKKEIESLY